jgi:hypothetical protein
MFTVNMTQVVTGGKRKLCTEKLHTLIYTVHKKYYGDYKKDDKNGRTCSMHLGRETSTKIIRAKFLERTAMRRHTHRRKAVIKTDLKHRGHVCQDLDSINMARAGPGGGQHSNGDQFLKKRSCVYL